MARFLTDWKGLAVAAGLATACAAQAGATDGDLYYTTFSGGSNVWRVHYSYDGSSTFVLSSDTNIASANGADGIIFAPNGDLLVGGQSSQQVHEYTTGGTLVTDAATNSNHDSDHVVLNPNNGTVYSMGYFGNGSISSLPFPLASGTDHAVTGDSNGATSLAWVGKQAFYTFSGPTGVGDFGTIDLSTYTTTRLMANLPAAHGMSYDSFTGDLMLYGSDHITQLQDIGGTWTVVSDREFTGAQFDQGTPDGKGHLFVADNTGNMLFIDYSSSGLIGSVSNFTYYQFFKGSLDDLAPLSGPGSSSVPGPLAVIPFAAGWIVSVRRRRARR